MTMFTEDEIKAKVQDGYIVESPEEMTEGYRKALVVQLTVQADTELMSAPAYWLAARHAPSTNTQVSAHAIIQDELAHANIAYRLLEDMGVSKEQLVLRLLCGEARVAPAELDPHPAVDLPVGSGLACEVALDARAVLGRLRVFLNHACFSGNGL